MTSSAVELRYMTVSQRGSVGTARLKDIIAVNACPILITWSKGVPSSGVVKDVEFENGPTPTVVAA